MTAASARAAPAPPAFGVYRVAELRALGWDRPAVDRAVRRDEFWRVRRGVYAVGARPDDVDDHHLRRLAAALLTMGPRSIASHVSAALLWDLPVYGSRATVTVTVARATHRVYDGLSVHVAGVSAEDRTVHHGLPVTSLGRTLVDLARTGGRRRGLVAADAALHRLSADRRAELLTDWDRALADARGWPGVGAARWVRQHADHRAESPLESLTRLVCLDDESLPAFEPQFEVTVAGVLHRVDGVMTGTRVAIECDGRLKYRQATLEHVETVEERVWRDRRRDWRLGEAGWVVVHVTWDDVTRRSQLIPVRIRAAIALAARRPS